MRKIISLLICLFPITLFANIYPLPKFGNSVVGQVQVTTVEPGDTFWTIARKYDVGYYELVETNPQLDPRNPKPWSKITIPSSYILPNAKRQGIVINLAEMRLFYFPKGQDIVVTYPLGIGREGWQTPQGQTKIIDKRKDPTWHVPESIRKARALEGVFLPESVKPGPENPLGNYAMRLGWTTYLIHGTNDPDGVGMRSSSGCLRLFPEDIEKLFSDVSVGTEVTVVDQPYKIGFEDGHLMMEAHQPLQENQVDGLTNNTAVAAAISEVTKEYLVDINWSAAYEAATGQNGIPVMIGTSMPLRFVDTNDGSYS